MCSCGGVRQPNKLRQPFHLCQQRYPEVQYVVEVHKCVQLNRCSVVCGRVLPEGAEGITDVGEWAGESEGGED